MSADNLPRGVAGRCPGCGQHSLSVMSGGHVTCRRIECPHPTAADELLHLDHGHVMTLAADRFHLEHPATCRLGGRQLADCVVDRALTGLDGPPAGLSIGQRYRVDLRDGELSFREAGDELG